MPRLKFYYAARVARPPLSLVCPKCGGTMRVTSLIQEPQVIDKILKHLRAKGRDARAGPWATGPPAGAATSEAA